jgi:hypothetical protein
MRFTFLTVFTILFFLLACGQKSQDTTATGASNEDTTSAENQDTLPEGKVTDRYNDGSKKTVIKSLWVIW